jgi:hypothetical protein
VSLYAKALVLALATFVVGISVPVYAVPFAVAAMLLGGALLMERGL